MRWMFPFLALAAGCDVAEVDMPFDDDADGLMSNEEEALGTDPLDPDSDSDGWMDGEEADSYTDALDADDHPYTGGWEIDACRAQMDDEGTGTAVGDVAPNFALTDQYGDTLRLHDFCGKAVEIVSAAFW